MKIERYEKVHQARWDGFVRAAKNAHFMHERAYMDYHADRFSDHSLIFSDDKGTWLALLPANEKDKTLYSHQGLSFGGLIASPDLRMAQTMEIFAFLNAYAREAGFEKIVYKAMPSFYHRAPCAEDLYALFRHGAALIRTDVSTTIDYAHRLPFSTLRRRGAKKAAKENVIVRMTNDIESFHPIIAQIVREKYDTAPTHTLEEMTLLANRFPRNIHLHGAYLGEALLAGVLIFETDTAAHAQYIGADEQGRLNGALDLLFTTLIEETYSAKRFFDFGISTEQGGAVLNENLIAQKEGFGGRATVHQFFELPL